MVLSEKNPNAFYKKIWFWLIVLGLLFVLFIVFLYLYTDYLNSLDYLYAYLGLALAILFLGALISLTSFKAEEPTIKTFMGVDTGVTEEDLIQMSYPELRKLFSDVTGVPLQQIPK